jgi:hypothetical protein
MLGELGAPMLRSINTMTQFSPLFEHQTSHVACFNARGLLYECIFDTLLFFLVVPTCWETCFSSRHYSTFFFFSSSFFGPSYRPSYPPRCSDTTHECIFDAL